MTASTSPIVLERAVLVDGSIIQEKDGMDTTLRLCMLGCETQPPYGPIPHTANLLLDLIAAAASATTTISGIIPKNSTTASTMPRKIVLELFDATNQEYPDDIHVYDGVLLPGSFSSAYQELPWIKRLKEYIQEMIVQDQISTLAICFGHQLFAHSFGKNGRCVPTPSGSRAGRFQLPLFEAGRDLWGVPSLELFYTHGDMVQQIPDTAVALGGSPGLPFQAVAYYSGNINADTRSKRPYAISLQGHPEYAVSKENGVQQTLSSCMMEMEKHGHLNSETRHRSLQDAEEHFEKVRADSILAIAKVGQALGWLP
jgi:GMP synthase-like glutamine amidotransferase